MSRFPARFATLTALAVASSAPAIDLGFGLLKRRQNPSAQQPQQPPKPEPAQRVKQLVVSLQSDPDVTHRKAAVDELRAADARGTAEVLAALASSLQRDPSPAVRSAVAEALGEAKSGSVAAVLAEVEKSDPDASVRAAAKTALWRHQLNAQKMTGSTAPTGEPLFALPSVPVSPRTAASAMPATNFQPITQGPGRGGLYRETAEPPFADPKTGAAPIPVAVAPPQPVPMPLPTPTAQPGDLPPLNIPLVSPVIIAPPPGPGLPTIVPPGR